MEPLQLAFTVGCPPEHAFAVWAQRTSLWWPKSHSVSGDPELTVTFEPRPGGRIFERTPAGDEHDWGEVVAWEPPRRLAYLWHLRQDRADATHVEVSFAPADDGTAVTIVHSGWERLGARAETARAQPARLGRAGAALRGVPEGRAPAVAGPPGRNEPAIFGHAADAARPGIRIGWRRWRRPPPPHPQQQQAACAATPSPSPPPPRPRPPADLAALRTVRRRWPRTVPEKRVFPRG